MPVCCSCLGVVLYLLITVVVVVCLPGLPVLAEAPPAPVGPAVRWVSRPLPGPRTGGLVALVVTVVQLLLLLLLLLAGVVNSPHVHLSPGGHLSLDVGVLKDGDPRVVSRPGSLLLVVVVEAGVVVVLDSQLSGQSSLLSLCNRD